MATGLVGCIRMLDVNNRVLNLQENGGDSLYGSGVGECGNNPCQPNPCKNSAACQVKEAEMFHCKCSKGFWGKMGESETVLPFSCFSSKMLRFPVVDILRDSLSSRVTQRSCKNFTAYFDGATPSRMSFFKPQHHCHGRSNVDKTTWKHSASVQGTTLWPVASSTSFPCFCPAAIVQSASVQHRLTSSDSYAQTLPGSCQVCLLLVVSAGCYVKLHSRMKIIVRVYF